MPRSVHEVRVTTRRRADRWIARHWRSASVHGAARLARGYLRAIENVNHDLWSNGEATAVRRMPHAIRTAVDVGANRGEWTALVLASHPGATVHAFEPTPDLVGDLQSRFADDPRFVLEPIALGSERGTASLYLNPRHDSMNSLVEAVAPDAATIDVAVRRGDDVLSDRGVGQIDYLKVDVEGHDLDVLRGFRGLLEAGKVDVVQFEYNVCTLSARRYLADYHELLEPLGYVIGKVHPDGVDFRPYSQDQENWRGPACIAVRRDLSPIVQALRSAPRRRG